MVREFRRMGFPLPIPGVPPSLWILGYGTAPVGHSPPHGPTPGASAGWIWSKYPAAALDIVAVLGSHRMAFKDFAYREKLGPTPYYTAL